MPSAPMNTAPAATVSHGAENRSPLLTERRRQVDVHGRRGEVHGGRGLATHRDLG